MYFLFYFALFMTSCLTINKEDPIRCGNCEWRNPYGLHLAEVVNNQDVFSFSDSPSHLWFCDTPNNRENMHYNIEISIWPIAEQDMGYIQSVIQWKLKNTKDELKSKHCRFDKTEVFEGTKEYRAAGYKSYFDCGESISGAVYCFNVEKELIEIVISSISKDRQSALSKKNQLDKFEETALCFKIASTSDNDSDEYLITESKDRKKGYYHSHEGHLLMRDNEKKRTYDMYEDLSDYFYSFPNYAIVGDALFLAGENGGCGEFCEDNLCKIDLSTGTVSHVLDAYHIIFQAKYRVEITERTLVDYGHGYWDSVWNTKTRTINLTEL